MKKFFKIGCLGIIGIIVLIIIISVATSGGGSSSKKTSTASTTTTKTTSSSNQSAGTSTQTKSTTSDNGVLTKAKFDKIQNGMTYDQVAQIIGSKGDLLSEAGDKGTQFYTEIYQFKTDGFMSNATMTFQGGKLINKAQIGLDSNSKVSITKAEYDQIQTGMTYEQVQKIIGGEGETISESGQKGSEFYTIMVEYKGEGNLGANANFMFQGDKLQSKSQLGLN